MRVIEGLYDGVSTSELDNLAAETVNDDCASRLCTVSSYCDLKFTFEYQKSFSETMNDMFHYVNQENGQYAPLLLKVHKVIMDNAEF
jgi:ribonucleoside-diphosphate reductase alpha chain